MAQRVYLLRPSRLTEAEARESSIAAYPRNIGHCRDGYETSLGGKLAA